MRSVWLWWRPVLAVASPWLPLARRRRLAALRRRERPGAVEKLGDRHRALLGAQRVHGREDAVAVEAGDHGDLVDVHD